MELILIMWISNIVCVWIMAYFYNRSIYKISSIMLQIEVIKKAKNFEEAEKYWSRNIVAEQELEEKKIDEQEKAFKDAKKEEEKNIDPEEKEWINEK